MCCNLSALLFLLFWSICVNLEHIYRGINLLVNLLKSKIHRATVTDADLNYIGSISIDEHLMKAAGLLEYEKVHILNITNGTRLETYVIKAKEGSGSICINGAAAHHVNKGDLVIIVAFCRIKEKNINIHKPKVVHVDHNNVIVDVSSSVQTAL